MGDIAKRLSGPALLSNAAATVYTVPAVTTTIVRNIHINNTSSSSVTVTVSIGANAAGTQIFTNLTLGANVTIDWTGFFVLAASETIQALSGTNSVVNLMISGVETT
jgi:hypothetical protein